MRMVFLAVTVSVVLYGLHGCGSSVATEDAVIRVNNRVITGQELKTVIADSGEYPKPGDFQAFLDRTVTREVLIQEAIRRGLDREESFRKALKSYYEQNLIRNVTDQIAEETPVAVSDEEVRRAYRDAGRVLSLRIHSFETARDAEAGEAGVAQQLNARVGDLPQVLEDAAFGLSQGETSRVIRAGERYYKVTLLETSHEPMPAFESVRESLRATLKARRRMEKLNSRIETLRRGATVTVDEPRLKELLKGEEGHANQG